jgi:hypothetical protein
VNQFYITRCYSSLYTRIHTDQEEPKIQSCPTNLVQETDLGKPTAMLEWVTPIATDNTGDDVAVICDPTSGSNFTIGQKEVVCEAMDSSGNKATCSFHVNVNGMYA